MINDFSKYNKLVKSAPARIKDLNDLKTYYGLRPCVNEEFQSKRNQTPNDYVEISYIQEDEKEYIDENSWKYVLNPWNFRNHWNFDPSRAKIGFFGCSFTFGEGIDTPNTFVDIVSKKFNLNPFNFGTGGSGVERVARTVSAAINLIDLEYVIITLPTWYRVLHIDDEGSMINLVPGYHHQRFKELSKQLTSLDEEFYATRALSLINWIYDVLNQKNIAQKNIKFLISSWDHPLNYLCKKVFPLHTIDPFPNIDDKQARDGRHPGVKSQKAHAEQIIKAFYDKNWF